MVPGDGGNQEGNTALRAVAGHGTPKSRDQILLIFTTSMPRQSRLARKS